MRPRPIASPSLRSRVLASLALLAVLLGAVASPCVGASLRPMHDGHCSIPADTPHPGHTPSGMPTGAPHAPPVCAAAFCVTALAVSIPAPLAVTSSHEIAVVLPLPPLSATPAVATPPPRR